MLSIVAPFLSTFTFPEHDGYTKHHIMLSITAPVLSIFTAHCFQKTPLHIANSRLLSVYFYTILLLEHPGDTSPLHVINYSSFCLTSQHTQNTLKTPLCPVNQRSASVFLHNTVLPELIFNLVKRGGSQEVRIQVSYIWIFIIWK
ncbi:hypothetical protein BsWGS_27276 [Bradybaena similaris]